jgi:hypothetical protein
VADRPFNLIEALLPLQAMASSALSLHADGDDAILFGGHYALHFTVDREGIEVTFAEVDASGNINWFGLRHLMFERFSAEDRSCYGTPCGVANRQAASAAVVVAGLGKRCKDVLAGPGPWLRRAGWAIAKPYGEAADIILGLVRARKNFAQ